jgi:hypothetical protein
MMCWIESRRSIESYMGKMMHLKVTSKEFARKIVAEVLKRKDELGWICS